jgi:3-methyl-2-oxobutanoate hydroxymethyltransferase
MIFRSRGKKVNLSDLLDAKSQRDLIPVLTAYDYPSAKLLDEAQIPLILVGDSLGMVRLGFPDTTHVTLDHMVMHTESVARANPKAMVISDLPYHTYLDEKTAVAAARRLIQAGADAVKAEGGKAIEPAIKAILAEGIPFVGHLGMLPQSVKEEGGYRKKGKTETERQLLKEDMQVLEAAGACAVVLELVIPDLAAEITQASSIPTIGIGSGPECDGQVLVLDDLVGGFPWFTPKFAKPKASIGKALKAAVMDWMNELESVSSKTKTSEPVPSLSHLDASGETRMVDVSAKPALYRVAVAEGRILTQSTTIDLIENQQIAKGNVLATARIAGIMAAKRTGELIPLCHPLPITHCHVGLAILPDRSGIEVKASASIHASTGVEMEALTAVQVALLTLYDMLKAVDKTMVMEGVRLISKTKSSTPITDKAIQDSLNS